MLLLGISRCVFVSGIVGIGGIGGVNCCCGCCCCSCARLTLRYRDIFWGTAVGGSVMSLAMLCDNRALAFLIVWYARDSIVH